MPNFQNVKPGDFEPEPNWRSMYEEMRKRFELADARAADINIRNLELASELKETKKALKGMQDAYNELERDYSVLMDDWMECGSGMWEW